MAVKRGSKFDLMYGEGSCPSNGPLGNLLILDLHTLLLNSEPRVVNAKYRGLEIEWELLELLQNTNKYVPFSVTGKKKKGGGARERVPLKFKINKMQRIFLLVNLFSLVLTMSRH